MFEPLPIRVGPAAAKPVIALHSGPGESHALLRPHLDRLASDGRAVVYYDQRGGPATWQDHVADLDRLIAKMGSPATLLGFSWGALLAVLYALEHRDRVERLVLVSFSLPDTPRAPPTSRPELDAAVKRFESEGAHFAARIAAFFHDPNRARELTPVARDEAAAAAVRTSLRGLDIRSRLASLQGLPMLVIHGADDPNPADTVPGAHVVTYLRCGHVPFVEATERFFPEVQAFLDAGRLPH